MKISEYRQHLQENPEFIKAEEELQLQLELANCVLRARLKKGWSQTDLANAIGTKQANISRIEAGLANPTINLIQKLIKALDIEIKISNTEHESIQKGFSGNSEYMHTQNAYKVQNWPNSNCKASYEIKTEASIEEGVFK